MAYVSGATQGKLNGYVAAADYSATSNQYKFVYISTAEASGVAGKVTLCTNATTQQPIGVLQNLPKAGQPAEVVVFGPTKISVATGTLSAGALLGHDANAQAVAYVAGSDTTKYVSGRALDTTTAQNQLVSAFINCVNLGRAA